MLPDRRISNAQWHNSLDVMPIAPPATICGAESCVDLADSSRDHRPLFREFLAWRATEPRHPLAPVSQLDPAAFAGCFARFVGGLRRSVGIQREPPHAAAHFDQPCGLALRACPSIR